MKSSSSCLGKTAKAVTTGSGTALVYTTEAQAESTISKLDVDILQFQLQQDGDKTKDMAKGEKSQNLCPYSFPLFL
jgi:hypothetical protein